MSLPENMPQLTPSESVQMLVRATVGVFDDRDDRMRTCFDQITTQAVIFAEEMQ